MFSCGVNITVCSRPHSFTQSLTHSGRLRFAWNSTGHPCWVLSTQVPGHCVLKPQINSPAKNTHMHGHTHAQAHVHTHTHTGMQSYTITILSQCLSYIYTKTGFFIPILLFIVFKYVGLTCINVDAIQIKNRLDKLVKQGLFESNIL